MSRYDWMGAALCAQTDPDLFHPEGSGYYARAQRVCAGCPVRPQCEAHAELLDAGIAAADRHGLWAGRTRRQRDISRPRLARTERRAAALNLIERDAMTAEEIAAQVGLSARTVFRIQKAYREQMEAAA